MLGVCSLIGLTLGLVGPTPPHASAITLTALALQTFTTVGALAPAAASIGGHHCGSLDCIWLRSP